MMGKVIWTLIGLLILLWVIGLLAKVGGAIIHFLLVIVAILFVINLLLGRRDS